MSDTIHWVAFRDRLAIDDWAGFISAKLNRSWPEWGEPFGWNEGSAYPDGLLAALQARTRGKAWRAPQNRREKAYKVRAGARRIICQTGADPKALADQLEADIREARSMDAALEDAKRGINEAVRDEQIEAFGRRAGVDRKALVNAVHDLIDAKLLIGPRVIEFDGTLMEDTEKPFSEIRGYTGPYFADIWFRVDDVLKLWPPTASATTSLRLAEISRVPVPKPLPEGKVEFHAIADHVRKVRHGAEAEPPLTPAERDLIANKDGLPSYPLVRDKYDRSKAREYLIGIQNTEAADWLRSIGALTDEDGRAVVDLDHLHLIEAATNAWETVSAKGILTASPPTENQPVPPKIAPNPANPTTGRKRGPKGKKTRFSAISGG